MSDKLIVLERPVYYKIWTGTIDCIISYDPEPEEPCTNFTVKDILTGKERKHSTSIDALNVSFSCNEDSFSKIDNKCIEYLIKSGVRGFTRLPSELYELIYDTSKDMENLIDILKKVNSGELEVNIEVEDGREYLIGEVVVDIGKYASNALISHEGKNHWENINKIEKEGFKVFAVEKDAFGWIIGGIRTDKGIAIYG